MKALLASSLFAMAQVFYAQSAQAECVDECYKYIPGQEPDPTKCNCVVVVEPAGWFSAPVTKTVTIDKKDHAKGCETGNLTGYDFCESPQAQGQGQQPQSQVGSKATNLKQK